MDGQGDDFPGLQLFPPDILAFIADSIPSEQLLRLKCTGARTLWYQLRRPHVVNSINLGTDFIRFSSWPAFLSEFPTIEELSIYSRSDAWWSKLGFSLELLPPALKRLKLSGNIESLDPFFLNGKVDVYTPHLMSIDLRGVIPEYFFFLRHLPSTMTTLHLGGLDSDSELPHSLVHLTIESTYKYHKAWGPNLPPLVSISIDTVPALKSLPRSLKSISGEKLSASDQNKLPENMGFIPPTLTELKLQSVLPSSSWPLLPPTLQTLCTCIEKSECATTKVKTWDPEFGISVEVPHYPIELLPRSLRYLEFNSSEKLRSYNSGIFMSVPWENCRLAALDADGSAMDISSSSPHEPMFPPHLTTFISPHLVLSPYAASHLPASLTRLRIRLLYEIMCKHLPSGLTDLQAKRVLMSPRLISLLPKSLTKLDFKYQRDVGANINYYTGTKAKYEVGPEAELHRAFRSYLDWNSDPLPPSLTSLRLRLFTQLGNSIIRDPSFPNLQELVIPDSIYFSDIAIPLLSRSLTSLDLSAASIVSGKSFPFLPKGLIELRLKKSSKIYDVEISHLPRKLKVLYLNTATNLTDSCISDFPRHLEYLDISHNTNITRNCFGDLPYPIRSCHTFIAATWSVTQGIFQKGSEEESSEEESSEGD